MVKFNKKSLKRKRGISILVLGFIVLTQHPFFARAQDDPGSRARALQKQYDNHNESAKVFQKHYDQVIDSGLTSDGELAGIAEHLKD